MSKITNYGAHIISWKNSNGEELLYLSPLVEFPPKIPIRGGIPVIFPQFSDMGPLDKHGWARTSVWESNPDGSMTLRKDSVTITLRYELINNGNTLTISFEVENESPSVFEFQFALHTYFAISDITKTKIVGLKDTEYLDNLQKRTRLVDKNDQIEFQGEVDRIYRAAPQDIKILDEHKEILIKSENLPEAVVWNPWIEKTKSIPDLKPESYKQFVCVERGVIAPKHQLGPNSKWISRVHYHYSKL